MSLYQDFKSSAEKFDNQKAVYFRGRFFTYNYVLKQIDLLADYLDKTMHLHENNIVSVCLNNSLFSFILIYALNKLGVIVNFINPGLPSDQIVYFDMTLDSRMMFLENDIYKNNVPTFKAIKNKIALLECKSFNILKLIRNLKFKKEFKTGIPFKYKIKNKRLNCDTKQNDSSRNVAIIAPNEKFIEKPYQASFLNEQLHQALLNQKALFDDMNDNVILLSPVSFLSLPFFVSFYHNGICNGITLFLDDFSNHRKIVKLLKKKKKLVFFGDFNAFNSLLHDKNAYLISLMKHIKKSYIYNDLQRDFIGEKWYKFMKENDLNAPLVSVIGSVETCGVFLAKEYEKENMMSYGKFIGNYQGYILKVSKRKDEGVLYIKSSSNMMGYYKQVDKNYEIMDESKGIKTDLIGVIDDFACFHLISSIYDNYEYSNDHPYLMNLKDMLMTIPGIKNICVSVALNQLNTLKIDVFADGNDNLRLTKEVSTYLDSQLKNTNTNYEIVFKD